MNNSTLKAKDSLNKIFCIVGPSGTGKTEISNMIPLPSVVSYRTRKPREGEVDGVDGHFISREEFLEKEKEDLWIAKTLYVNNYYGITQGELLELEDSPMLYVVDWPGVVGLKESLDKLEGYSHLQVVSIFLHTPRHDLEARMTKRRTEPEVIKARLDHADREYIINRNCDYIVENVNGQLAQTANEVMNIILRETFGYYTRKVTL